MFLNKKCSITFVFKFTKVSDLSCGRVTIKIFSPGCSDGNKDFFFGLGPFLQTFHVLFSVFKDSLLKLNLTLSSEVRCPFNGPQ